MAHIQNSNLYQLQTGTYDFSGACVVLVKTEWNTPVVNALESGCRKVLEQYGVANIVTITVPGAVEIPFAVKAYAGSEKMLKADAFITLGCVIKGDTPHFDYVCKAVTNGVTQLNLILKVPVIFGVLTVNTQAQADERIGGIGGKHGHKGEEAAITALKMIALNVSLKK